MPRCIPFRYYIEYESTNTILRIVITTKNAKKHGGG